jgi:hypothetical protein
VKADQPGWPSLLTDYEAAIAEFERASVELTAALAHRVTSRREFDSLLVAEARAREAVIVRRMRLINLWRATAETHSVD